MQSACAESRQSDAVELALARARRIEEREEVESYLFQLLHHECHGKSCRDCEVMAGITVLIRNRIFEERSLPDRPILA